MSYGYHSKWIETYPDGDEIEIEIGYDYSPAEPMTRNYPGCDAEVEFCEAIIVETAAEVCLMKDLKEEVRIEILEKIIESEKERQDYLKHGCPWDY